MSPLVPDEKIIFGLIASHWSNKTVHDLWKTYSHSNVNVATIAREVCTYMCVGGRGRGGRGRGRGEKGRGRGRRGEEEGKWEDGGGGRRRGERGGLNCLKERQERIVDCTRHSHTHTHAQILTYTLYTLSQLSLKDGDNVTPVILLPNTAHHSTDPHAPLELSCAATLESGPLNPRLIV